MLLAVLWAAMVLLNGLTKESGVRQPDVWIALTPLVIGPVLAQIVRWVVFGPRPSSRPLPPKLL